MPLGFSPLPVPCTDPAAVGSGGTAQAALSTLHMQALLVTEKG